VEKLQTPMVAGMGGAAILAALLSFGGGEKKTTPAPSTPDTNTPSKIDEANKSTSPNQDGPWRAVCEEYAPYGFGEENGQDSPQIPRGYKVFLQPNALSGTTEIKTKPDRQGQTYKIAVHKQLVGDLTSCIPASELGKIHMIVATLPDPDKTEMRLEFDRNVDALEKGAEVRGFHYTGYWFPWRSQQTGETPRKEDEVEAALLRNEQPGILLFHNNDGERLFIFVVGETPTSGINRIQMAQALRYRQDLLESYRKTTTPGNASQRAGKCPTSPAPNAQPGDGRPAASGDGAQASETCPPTKPLRVNAGLDGPLMIAGPLFSGSFASLHEVLRQSAYLVPGADKSRWVGIISPNTSSDVLTHKFLTQCKPASLCYFKSLSALGSVTDKTVAGYLGRLGYKSEQIAKLVEDESGSGDAQFYKTPGADSLPAGAKPPFGLTLTFPRELSTVRALSDQQSEQLAESGAKILSLAKAPAQVKLSGQGSIERDRPSTYASEDEATEISIAMEDRVRILREKNIECVVVTATNPLDLIFLLDYVHDRLPNVRLVAEGADELEVSHAHYIDLTGTIVVSSFPRVPGLTAVIDGVPTQVPFASDVAEAHFLSVASLLQEATTSDLAKDWRTNNFANGWMISIAGEEDFELVPYKDGKEIEAVDDKTVVFAKETDGAERKSDDRITLQIAESDKTPRSFISFSMAIFALTMIHLIMLLNSERPNTWKRVLASLGFNPKNRSLLKFAYVECDQKEDFSRTFNLLALNNQLFLLNLMILMINPVTFSFLTDPRVELSWIAAGGWVMSILTGIAVLSSLLRFAAHVWAALKNGLMLLTEKLILLFFSLLMAWYLVSSIHFLVSWRGSAVAEWQRILTLDDGLSPVVPIATILLAWALWAALQLRRVKWITYRKMDLCSAGSSVERYPLGRHVCEDMNAIHREIDAPVMGVRRVLFVLCFVGIVSWWQWGSLRGIESYSAWTGGTGMEAAGRLIRHILLPPSFEWWFAIWGFVMLLMTVMQTAYQLSEIWLKLRRLLYRLESTSMKYAFEKIGKDDRIHIKIWDLGKAALRFDEMSLTIESLMRMGYFSEACAAQRVVDTYQHADLEGRQPRQQDRDALNQALNVRLAHSIVQLDQPRANINGGSFELDRYLPRQQDRDALNQALNVRLADNIVQLDQPIANINGGSFELDRYLALRFITLIRYVLLQMRNLMWFVIYGYFLAVAAITFYPFQGGKNLSEMLAVTFVVVLVLMGMLVKGILRNPMLKRLEDPESNAASALQAFFHLLSVGGFPALALLAWQFPWIGRIAFSWLRPLLSAFH
jgi:hypothetical protein